MKFLKQGVHLPTPVYRALPALYLITAVVLWAAVDHPAATFASLALLVFAGTIMLKRINAR